MFFRHFTRLWSVSHVQVTKWLQEFSPLPEFCKEWAWVAAFRTYAIHHRERLREHLQNTILGIAVVINVLMTGFHNHQRPRGHYSHDWAQLGISVLGWCMLLLTALNCAVWLCIHYFTLQQSWSMRRGNKGNLRFPLLSFLYTLVLALMAAGALRFKHPADGNPIFSAPQTSYSQHNHDKRNQTWTYKYNRDHHHNVNHTQNLDYKRNRHHNCNCSHVCKPTRTTNVRLEKESNNIRLTYALTWGLGFTLVCAGLCTATSIGVCIGTCTGVCVGVGVAVCPGL